MPGRIVTELERRYGRPGNEVLEALRSAIAASGRVRPEDVDRIAAETRPPPRPRQRRRVVLLRPRTEPPRPPARPRLRRHRLLRGERRRAPRRRGRRRSGLPSAGSPTTAPSRCRPSTASATATAARPRSTASAPAPAPTSPASSAARSPRRDPEIPIAVDVDEPVVLAGVAGGGPDAWSAWERVRGPDAAATISREVNASGPARTRWRRLSGGGQVAGGVGGSERRAPVPDLQRRRGRPRLVRRPPADGARPAADPRGDGAGRRSPPERPTGSSTCAPSTRGPATPSRGAVADARAAGRLGGATGFDVEVVRGRGLLRRRRGDLADPLRRGAARRGRRPPPYPTERGYLHRPTVVNNVETLCAIPWIVDRGGDAYARLGVGDSRGTKVVCLNERFRRPGAYEVELGTSLRRDLHRARRRSPRRPRAGGRSRSAGRSEGSSAPTISTRR